nr:helix-turn-helix domain-containing protein [Natrinema saccharevitans]
MDDVSNQDQAIELLQQLGLKEYEARSFVALARRQRGTAKDISETSEVPGHASTTRFAYSNRRGW